MSKYTSSIFVAILAANLPIAQPIARAFDPDSGGDKSFDVIRATKSGTTYAICYTQATPETVAGLGHFKTVAGALHDFVMQDYSARWGNLTAPTLADCEAFRAAIILQTGVSLSDALASAGMVLVQPTE